MSSRPIKLSRAQHRQLQKLAEKVDRITQADRRFFERFPHRQHRIRLMSQAEIDQTALLDGKPPWIPQGFELFTVVRNIAPGYRMRLFAGRPERLRDGSGRSDVPRGLRAGATPKTWVIEAETRCMAAGSSP